jgi:isopenicillin-N epimerase
LPSNEDLMPDRNRGPEGAGSRGSTKEPTAAAHASPATEPGLAAHWLIEPGTIFLNHGSFGACPRDILLTQRSLRERLEAQPVRFLSRDLEGLLDAAREELGRFLGGDPEGLAFVPNATAGVNTVLRSLHFAPGDELLTTDHEYNASVNALRLAAQRDGARVVVAHIPFPITSPGEALGAILGCVTPRTRLALLSHVTSPTALVLPLGELVPELRRRGVETLVDGAHAPGMLPLELDALGAAYYTGNAHKWLCAPKGAAFLYVRADRRSAIRPLAISHGANATRTDRPRFRVEFDWTGTFDPTAYLCIPAAIRFVGSLLPGGWPEVRAANGQLARAGRDAICQALGVAPPAPDEMLGSMAAVLLPGDPSPSSALSPLDDDPLQVVLREHFGIEVPVLPWPQAWSTGEQVPRRLIRVSAHLYNSMAQYDALAAALVELLRG